jgi:hypothetical protein
MQLPDPADSIALYFGNSFMIRDRFPLDFLPSTFRQGEQYE